VKIGWEKLYFELKNERKRDTKEEEEEYKR